MFGKLLCTMLAASAMCICGLQAQVKTYEVTPGTFSGISVSNDFVLSVEEGDEYSVEIVVDDMLKEYVQVANDSGVLSIYLEEKKITSEVKRYYRGRNAGTPVFRAVVTMPSGLRSLTMSGNASLRSMASGVVDPDTFTMTLGGNASVPSLSIDAGNVSLSFDRKSRGRLDVICDRLSLNVAGTSDVTVTRRCRTTEVAISYMGSLVLDGSSESMLVDAKGSARAIFNGETAFARYVLSGTVNVNAVNMKCEEANVEITGMCTLTEAAAERLFVTMSGGGKLIFKNSPEVYVNGIRNSSVMKYDESEVQHDDSDRRSL